MALGAAISLRKIAETAELKISLSTVHVNAVLMYQSIDCMEREGITLHHLLTDVRGILEKLNELVLKSKAA
jgi:hypothetical protein